MAGGRVAGPPGGGGASFLRQVCALGGIAFRDGLRRRAAWACGSLFVLLAALGAVPFSPGVPAGVPAYRAAGLSTLFLGGLLLAVLVAPVLCSPGRGSGGRGEHLLALPLRPGVLPAGLLLGFSGVVFLYHGGGALLLCLVHRSAGAPGGGWGYFWKGAAFSCLTALLAASVVLCASRRLSFSASAGVTVLWVCLALGVELLPPPLRIFFPAPGTFDPTNLAEASTGTAAIAAVHLACLISAYLLAAQLVSPALRRGEGA